MNQNPYRIKLDKILVRRNIMGKYIIAWILGVPLSLLILIYLISHLFS